MTLHARHGSHGPSELIRLQREIDRLRVALKPFALAAECAESDEGNDYCLDGSSARYELTLGDLRRAAAALHDEQSNEVRDGMV